MIRNSILLFLMISPFAILRAQEITSKELVGTWVINKDNKAAEFIFRGDSTFISNDTTARDGNYIVDLIGIEYVLNLEINTNFITVPKYYLIRRVDSTFFKLQVPQIINHATIVFSWQKETNQNTYLLFKEIGGCVK